MTLLLTPGPLTTSHAVKQAASQDIPSRDVTLTTIVKEISTKLLDLCQLKKNHYSVIPMQGSGTFAIESVIASINDQRSRWLVIINGAYGERIQAMLRRYKIPHESLQYSFNQSPKEEEIRSFLKRNPSITHLAVVHCETTTGLINDIETIGRCAKQHGLTYVVDAMSSLGGIPIDIPQCEIDFLISSPNKCFASIPGFAFVIAKNSALLANQGRSRSIVLDLIDQWQVLQKTGQFRFTPPVQSIAAFNVALDELIAEGGIIARNQRYQKNQMILLEGMTNLGFETYLSLEQQGPIITTFLCPMSTKFSFERFYQSLKQNGYLIYPGKVPGIDGFRIGSIGHLFQEDMQRFIKTVTKVMNDL